MQRTCACPLRANSGHSSAFGSMNTLLLAVHSARTNWGQKMTQWTGRRQKFRAVLNGAECFRPASVFDPLSARIAENLGFEIGLFAGSTAALTILGAPDLVLLTATELVQQAQRICRATNMPLLVDGDHGYGNALNVARTIEELANVGVAAATVEDTILPTPFNAASGATTLISLEEAVGKMRAAVKARPDKLFSVIGRTNA